MPLEEAQRRYGKALAVTAGSLIIVARCLLLLAAGPPCIDLIDIKGVVMGQKARNSPGSAIGRQSCASASKTDRFHDGSKTYCRAAEQT